jgi:peptide-methionine (S)-S-oxide reductase
MTELITLAGGCFWCVEAVLVDLTGVEEAVSGYAGGHVSDPTYEQVSGGRTGHAEAVQVTFDPEQISLHDLLTIFFTLHDPTTLDRQGNDVGPQYRSAVFFRNEQQRLMAMQVMEEISDQGIWEDPIVTTLEPFTEFYPAEDYHQEYFKQHGSQAYCQVVIAPKVAKLRKQFHDKLRADAE